jgi:hypothetical protein
MLTDGRQAKVLIIFGTVLVAPLISAALLSGMSRDREIKMTIWRAGKHARIDKSSPDYNPILQTVQEIMAACQPGRFLQLAMFRATFRQLYNDEYMVEIVYPSKQTVNGSVQDGGQCALTFDRVVIPLSGQYARNTTVVFYGTGQVGGGPFSVDAEFGEHLRRLLEVSR